LIVVECKADILKHESKNRNEFADFAVDGEPLRIKHHILLTNKRSKAKPHLLQNLQIHFCFCFRVLSKNPRITKLLKNASKNGSGIGKPEFLISIDDEKEVLSDYVFSIPFI
jgi:hypothetical protein